MIPWFPMTEFSLLFRGVARGGGAGGPKPPQNLADQLILFKSRGADYVPHTTASSPRIQKAIYTSAILVASNLGKPTGPVHCSGDKVPTVLIIIKAFY